MSNTITLSAPGERIDIMDIPRAEALVAGWKDQLLLSPGGTVGKIDLSGRSYTKEGAEIIADFLSPAIVAFVTEVALGDIIASRMEDEAIQVLRTICDLFQQSPLVQVNLSDNAMGCKGIEACRSVLTRPSLSKLFLQNNGLSAESMELLASTSPSLPSAPLLDGVCQNLTVLHFYNNMSGQGGAEAMAALLPRCSNLRSLRYSGCRQGREGSFALALGLEALTASSISLQELDLEGSIFGKADDGGISQDALGPLTNAIQRLRQLTRLNLRDCSLGTDGAIHVLQAVSQATTSLAFLDISENEIERGAADVIAEVLTINKSTLSTLCAEDNELTSVGAQKIANVYHHTDATGTMTALETLRLGNNEIGHIGAVALATAVLPNLKSINLDGNAFSLRDVERLEDAFGHKLEAMDENSEDDDADENVDWEEDEDDEEQVEEEEEVTAEEPSDLDLGDFTQQFSQQHL